MWFKSIGKRNLKKERLSSPCWAGASLSASPAQLRACPHPPPSPARGHDCLDRAQAPATPWPPCTGVAGRVVPRGRGEPTPVYFILCPAFFSLAKCSTGELAALTAVRSADHCRCSTVAATLTHAAPLRLELPRAPACAFDWAKVEPNLGISPPLPTMAAVGRCAWSESPMPSLSLSIFLHAKLAMACRSFLSSYYREWSFGLPSSDLAGVNRVATSAIRAAVHAPLPQLLHLSPPRVPVCAGNRLVAPSPTETSPRGEMWPLAPLPLSLCLASGATGPTRSGSVELGVHQSRDV
jgi:hypothetical protein